uniref:Large ribosomal subunit protein bL35m n=1 Tax=Esox lucius TaxID=8010 RepID=A0AAY5K332_ESOLU
MRFTARFLLYIIRSLSEQTYIYYLFMLLSFHLYIGKIRAIYFFKQHKTGVCVGLCPCSVAPLIPRLVQQPSRNLTYISLKKGKRKSVRSVVKRFMRLHCGLWIRRKAGYKKKLWKKMPARKKRLREHVFCNRTQSKLLDKMTSKFWKRRNWFVNDPYKKYHDRVNLEV